MTKVHSTNPTKSTSLARESAPKTPTDYRRHKKEELVMLIEKFDIANKKKERKLVKMKSKIDKMSIICKKQYDKNLELIKKLTECECIISELMKDRDLYKNNFERLEKNIRSGDHGVQTHSLTRDAIAIIIDQGLQPIDDVPTTLREKIRTPRRLPRR